MVLTILTLIALLLAGPVSAQDNPAGNQPGNAIPVRCVNTLGTAFEACGGGGAAGTDVNISGVGGVAVGVGGLPVTFANTSIAISGTVAVTGTFWQVTQPVSHANFANLDAALSTLANQTTLALIKAKTDNLDVLLSTRTKPADQQHILIDSTLPAFAAIPAFKIDQTTPGTTNRVDVGVFPDNEPFNVAQFGGSAVTLGQATSAASIPVVLPSNWLPPPDRAATSTIATNGAVASITAGGTGTVTVAITGTWVGSLLFFGIDGSGAGNALYAVNGVSGQPETSIAANGIWEIPSAGWSSIGLTSTSWTSGTATIALIAGMQSNVVMLGRSLPTGVNPIGQVTANAGTNLNTSLLSTSANQTTELSYLAILANARNGPPLPLFPCNAVRQTKCQPKGY